FLQVVQLKIVSLCLPAKDAKLRQAAAIKRCWSDLKHLIKIKESLCTPWAYKGFFLATDGRMPKMNIIAPHRRVRLRARTMAAEKGNPPKNISAESGVSSRDCSVAPVSGAVVGALPVGTPEKTPCSLGRKWKFEKGQ